jgi:hypothetical protein
MKIIFCIVDDISTYANSEIQNTIKNILDFTVSNLYIKGYDVIVDKDEDALLQRARSYDFAVVMSPGTEYINGYDFFIALENLITQDFFLAGHILDRTAQNAYYELHHQCYVINMTYYNLLDCPLVGKLEIGNSHIQIEPLRSTENWHDDYTPTFIVPGKIQRSYLHRCHGWNLIRIALEQSYAILVFNDSIRNNKKHYYPESEKDFYKHKEYIDKKIKYCEEEFIHIENTEWTTGIIEKYNQIVVPASGTLYLNLIENGRIVFYDYNKRALDYWKENCIRKDTIEYVFVYTDLLNEISLVDYLDPNLKTLVNLSNIFCYEGTSAKYSLKHRLWAQENLVHKLNATIKNIDINFTMKADAGH